MPMYGTQLKLVELANNIRWQVEASAKTYLYPSVLKKVYSYEATPYSVSRRRHNRDNGIGDPDNVYVVSGADSNGIFFDVALLAKFQGTGGEWFGEDLYDVVEKGDPRFNQPYERPFLDDFIEEVADDAEDYAADYIEAELEALAALATQGNEELYAEYNLGIDKEYASVMSRAQQAVIKTPQRVLETLRRAGGNSNG